MRENILYIVLPAYNEEANIEEVVLKWNSIITSINKYSRLVVINDGSKDTTGEILANLAVKCPQVVHISKINSGHGATCLYGYQYAIQNHADYIFQTDSDGQTDENEFWQFWSLRENYDFVIGQRKMRKDGRDRILVSFVLKVVLWMVFNVWIKDPNTPFRLMNGSRLAKLLEIIPADFFLSNVAISVIATSRKEKLKWLPISFGARQAGKNSINFKRIIKIGFRSISDFEVIKRNLRRENEEY